LRGCAGSLTPPALPWRNLRITVIIPALNEEAVIASLLRALQPEFADIIVVDGGSHDQTVARARQAGAQVISATGGRGPQLNAGAALASSEALWFLHADASPAPGSRAAITQALASAEAGVFRVRFTGATSAAHFLTWLYPRLAHLGLIYGDSGLFVRRATFHAHGGFAPFPLFEDVHLIGRLRRRVPFTRLDTELGASSRRFESRPRRTWLLWITLQLLYWLGAPPALLARAYHRSSRPPRPTTNEQR